MVLPQIFEFYYGGSSAIGWLGGVAFDARGWPAVAVMILVVAGIAAALAAQFLRDACTPERENRYADPVD